MPNGPKDLVPGFPPGRPQTDGEGGAKGGDAWQALNPNHCVCECECEIMSVSVSV